MKSEKRVEILEAFASSKPTEFDGFLLRYCEAHPEPEVESVGPPTVTPIMIEDAQFTVDEPVKRRRIKRTPEVTENETVEVASDV